MKKIVALVLSLVMALSLATVAFAVDFKDGQTLYSKDGQVTYQPAKTEKDGSGNLAYYKGTVGNYVECTKDTKDAIALYEVENPLNGDAVAVYVKAAEKDDIFYQYTVKAVDASKFTCSTDEHAKGYVVVGGSDDGKYLVDYDKAQYYGIANLDGKLIKVEWTTNIEGTHLLYQYKSKEVSTGVYVYKCAFCGKEYNATTIKAYAGTNYATYSAPTKIVELLFASDRNDFQAQWAKVMKSLDLKASDFDYGTLYLIGEAKPDNGVKPVPSAKTFDAGVAMYVGMSLLSVAGGAVVIGKKKEF